MQVTQEQADQFEDFISKIPVSKVRSDIERLWDKVKYSGFRFQTEQLDKLNDLATHLPAELQVFPQAFAHWVKNEDHTIQNEFVAGTEKKAQANLGEGVKSVLKGEKVMDKNVEDNTLSEYDDRYGHDAPKETDAKKEVRASLAEESKAGEVKPAIADKKAKTEKVKSKGK